METSQEQGDLLHAGFEETISEMKDDQSSTVRTRPRHRKSASSGEAFSLFSQRRIKQSQSVLSIQIPKEPLPFLKDLPQFTNMNRRSSLSKIPGFGSPMTGNKKAIMLLAETIERDVHVLERHPRILEAIINAMDALQTERCETKAHQLQNSLFSSALKTMKRSMKNIEAFSWLSQYFTPEHRSSSGRLRDSGQSPSLLRNSVSSTFKNKSSFDFAHVISTPGNSDTDSPLESISNSSIQHLLDKVHFWDFDVFTFREACNGMPLTVIMMYIYHRFQFGEKYQVDASVFCAFASCIESKYLDVPYHNSLHACDVVQATLFFLVNTELSNFLPDEYSFAATIAAAAHDMGHRGRNNAFEIASGSELALRYNDLHVLENYHVATMFEILKEEKLGVFSNLPKAMYWEIRQTIVKMILATDMKSHFGIVASLKTCVENAELTHQEVFFDPDDEEDRNLILCAAIHSADISCPTRAWDKAKRWTDMLEEEWFQQGDQEKKLGLEVSPMMDRDHPTTFESQMGFYSFIVKPLYESLHKAIGNLEEPLAHLEENIQHMNKLHEQDKSG